MPPRRRRRPAQPAAEDPPTSDASSESPSESNAPAELEPLPRSRHGPPALGQRRWADLRLAVGAAARAGAQDRHLGACAAPAAGGRITRDDVTHAADAPAAAGRRGRSGAAAPRPQAPSGGSGLDLLPWPKVDFEKFGPVERVARTRIQRISAPNLARNWVMIPHVTHNDEADITELEEWRKLLNKQHEREGVKFTMVSFLVKASVAALKQFEIVNSSLDGDELVLKRYYNIGFAADTPNGLVVPGDQGRRHEGPQADRRRT